MNYKISLTSNNGTVDYKDGTVSLTAKDDSEDTRFSLSLEFSVWESDAYVFLPACAYNGNRFKKWSGTYPPMYNIEDLRINAEPLITDVPALNPYGSGKIEVTSGDLATPCCSVFFKKAKRALFIFTEQAVGGKNIGFSVESGNLTVQLPAIRSKCYRMCRTNEPSLDTGIAVKSGEEIKSKLLIKEFDCESIAQFFEIFFKNRKCLLRGTHAKNGYTKELWDIAEEHMNRDNYNGEYYAEASKNWQCGWVGGGMSTLPLYKHGNELAKSRAVGTIDFMTSHQAPSGLFYAKILNGGIIGDDGGNKEHMKNATLIRKNGDALYHLFKHFDVIPPKDSWVSAAKKCADAFFSLYEKYKDFGHFVNIETGEIMVGGTSSGASAVGALARAYQYFGEEKYLEAATFMGEKYHSKFVARGYTYGGPREALCNPDSESSYAMVESMTVLYELTKEAKWLEYAKNSLHLMSSWVMSYSYEFPCKSEFNRLNINTVGSVFANTQNKHSSPGIATASGDAIYKIYKYTKDEDYLELLRDIAFFIPQCVSTNERPIYSWDAEPRRLLSGWINERVNTSDWQGPLCIGEVFYGTCWCESALLLSFGDLIFNKEISDALGK